MSIRVFALAKDLNVDKNLVMEWCSQNGLVTMGRSALASISDEDAVKVREHFAKGTARPSRTPIADTQRPVEPPKGLVSGRVPTLPSKPRRTEKADPAKVETTKEAGNIAVEETLLQDDILQNETGTAAAETVSEENSVSAVMEPESAGPQVSEKMPESKDETMSVEPAGKEPAEPETVSEAETLTESADDSSEKQKEKKAGTADVSSTDAADEKRTSSAGRSSVKESGSKKSKETKEAKETKESAGKERRKSTSASSRKSKKEAAAEPVVRPQGLSVAEKIAMQAQMEAPVRPVFDTSMPTLSGNRPARHEEKDVPKSNAHREERRAPGLRLAPLPAAKIPVAKKPAESEGGMKPALRLTKEEILAARAGDESIMRRMEQELEKNRTKDAGKESRNRSKDGKGREKSGANMGTADRQGDKKGRRGTGIAEKGVRPSVPTPAAMDDTSSKFGKKTAGKQRKELGKRAGMGEMESQHAPGRDSRFGAADKRGRSRRIHMDDDDDDGSRVRWKKQKGGGSVNVAAPRKSSYVLQLPLTVRSFAEGVGLTAAKVLGKLMMEFGMPMTITSALDETTVQLLAESFGIPVDIRPEVTLEERLLGDLDKDDDNEEDLVARPPVVTFLGHVDHGKTSLLDRIININVVSGEKGGITQHIRAYNVKYEDRSVTFVDTPGHEAFTEMRARGANTTDIAVIVVAADDGVMPQTEEAISHARAAEVPIIVALNKIDLPGVNEMRILQELAANELTPSEWGGEVEVVRCSALTGEGIDNLMETILMVAELQEFRANPKRAARGVCVESSIQQGRGVVAKLLVQNGTLHTGDVMVCGSTYGRVKVMVDTLDPHKKYQTAGPAIPVNVLGLDSAPGAGDKFYVLDEIADARRLAEERAEQEHLSQLAGSAKSHITLEGLFDSLGSREVKTLNIILRTDVRGSIEAIKKELGKLEHEEVQISILQASVGGITEADVQLADASDAIIVGFNVVPDENARALAEQKGVQVRRYDIIYQLTADVKAALEGMLTPEEHEKELGRAIVQQTFQISKVGTVAGCRVISGSILRDCKIRIIRNNRVIGTYSLDTLKREKDDVKEVRDGYECGMRLAGFNDVKEGDIFEAFQIESVARTF